MLRKTVRKIKKLIINKPDEAVLEPTNLCNLDCKYCMVGMQEELVEKHGMASHSLMSRQRGVMDKAVFEKAVTDFKRFGIKKVLVCFQGEPLLNPSIGDYLKKLKREGFEVNMFTNGILFDEKKIKEIIDSGCDSVRFSIDGISQESYGENRKNGEYEKAMNNLKKFHEMSVGKNILVEWQFVALKNNEHEIERAKKLAKEIGVSFVLKKYRITDIALRPVDPALWATYIEKPCTDIYKQICVYWNGDVVPCCYDNDGRQIMGNIMKDSLRSIWKAEKYTTFRKKVDQALRGNPEEPDICRSCLRWK